MSSQGGQLKEITSTTLVQPGTSVRQVEQVSFATVALGVGTRISLEVEGTAYAVTVGESVDGSAVTATWASILGALDYKVTQGGMVTVDADGGQRTLTLTAVQPNTDFEVGNVLVQTLSTGDILDAVSSKGAEPTQKAGLDRPQISDVAFRVGALDDAASYQVVINGHVYSARSGTNQTLTLTETGSRQITFDAYTWQTLSGFGANAADTTDPDMDRTVKIDFTPAASTQYTLTIDGHAYSYTTGASDSAGTLATKLQEKINSALYGSSVNSGTATLTLTTGAGDVDVTLTTSAGAVGTISAKDVPDVNYDRTIDLSGVTLRANAEYVVTIAGTDFKVTTGPSIAGYTLQDLADDLAAKIDASASYAANASGATTTITITSGAGDKTITFGNSRYQQRLASVAQVVVSSTSNNQRTIALAGLAATTNAVYTVTIGSDVYSTGPVAAGTSLQAIATSLGNAIVGDPSTSYGSTLRSNTVATGSWTSLLSELEARIESGEAIKVTATVTTDPEVAQLTMEAIDDNTPFSVDQVAVRADADVLANGSTPLVYAAADAAQQSEIRFASTLPGNAAYTIVVNGDAYTVSVPSRIANSWSAILGEFESLIEAGQTGLTVTVEAANQRLVLTANANDTPFTVDLVTRSLTAQVVTESVSTTAATANAPETDVITFLPTTVAQGYIYTVTLDGVAYRVTAGDPNTDASTVDATWTGVLNGLATKINAGILDQDLDRTIGFTFTPANSTSYTLTLGDDISYTVTTDASATADELAQAFLDALGTDYGAQASGSVLTLTTGAGGADITLSGTGAAGATINAKATAQSAVTATYDTATRKLTLTGKTNGQSLGGVSAEVKTTGSDVTRDGSGPTQAAGVRQPQISKVVLSDRTPEDASTYTVTIDGDDYTVTVGQDGVDATTGSVLAGLASVINAADIGINATQDANTRTLTLTATADNTPFEVDGVDVQFHRTSTVPNVSKIKNLREPGETAVQKQLLQFPHGSDDATPGASVTYQVTVNTTTYTVKVKDTVGGNEVQATWASVLGALKTLIEVDGVVTAAVDATAHTLTLTATAANTRFTAGGSASDTNAAFPLSMPGDYVLILQQRSTGDYNLQAAGNLTVVNLPTHTGEKITLKAGTGKDLWW